MQTATQTNAISEFLERKGMNYTVAKEQATRVNSAGETVIIPGQFNLIRSTDERVISPGTVSGGVQITARSGGSGRSRTRANARWPSSSGCFGLTACTAPANEPARRLRHTVAPTLPARADAPMTATERGVSRRSRWRMVTVGMCCAGASVRAAVRRSNGSLAVASGSRLRRIKSPRGARARYAAVTRD